jgi:hypothetical protein
MKVLIGRKLINLKDCIGYTKDYYNHHKVFYDTKLGKHIFYDGPKYYLVYERFDKTTLLPIDIYNDFSDLDFYKIKYIDLKQYVKYYIIQKNINDKDIKFSGMLVCYDWLKKYCRFDENM